MISFVKIQDIGEKKAQKKAYRELRDLYYRAFPRRERISISLLKKKALSSKADFFGAYDQENFVGLLYCVYDRDLIYIFWFAVNDKVRGSGYGSRILREFIKKNPGRRILLNIEDTKEPCRNQSQRERRKKFYKKNGFEELGYRVREKGGSFEVLSHGGYVKKQEYEQLMRNYLGRISFASYYSMRQKRF